MMTAALLVVACSGEVLSPAPVPAGPVAPAAASIGVPRAARTHPPLVDGADLVLTRDGVWLDGASIAAIREGAIAPPPAHELVLPALVDALSARPAGGAAPDRVRLWAEAELPYHLVRRALLSASMAQVAAIDLVTRDASGALGAVAQGVPPGCPPGGPPGSRCLYARIEQTDGGWWVVAERSERRAAGCHPGVLSPPRSVASQTLPLDSEAPWTGRALVSRPGACPSLPAVEALPDLLAQAAIAAPPCDFGELIPAKETPWQEAFTALEAASAAGGIAGLRFGVGLGAAPPGCEEAFSLAPPPTGG
jgi:hypothetical protein